MRGEVKDCPGSEFEHSTTLEDFQYSSVKKKKKISSTVTILVLGAFAVVKIMLFCHVKSLFYDFIILFYNISFN